MKIGLHLGMTGKIYAGTLNKKGNMFLQKEDKTLEAVNAVKELIEQNNIKNLTTEITDNEYRYILSVKKIQKKGWKDERYIF